MFEKVIKKLFHREKDWLLAIQLMAVSSDFYLDYEIAAKKPHLKARAKCERGVGLKARLS
jgi:hypothetical protein